MWKIYCSAGNKCNVTRNAGPHHGSLWPSCNARVCRTHSGALRSDFNTFLVLLNAIFSSAVLGQAQPAIFHSFGNSIFNIYF